MIKMSIDEMVSELNALASKKVCITFHSVGDTDSVSSAFGIASILGNATIATPDYITSNSRRILELFGYDPSSISTSIGQDFDAVILVDVNNYEDCGSFSEILKSYGSKVLVIDHHAPNNSPIRGYNDENYNSAASIVYAILKKLNYHIGPNLASLLAAGIISDSAEFKNSMPDTFIQLGELLKLAGTDYMDILTRISLVGDVNGRHATFVDIQESHAEVYNNLLVVRGKAHSHSNLAADNAIRCGVDLALFHSFNDSEVSFSSRLRPTLDSKYGIHLGKISQKLAYLIDGTGGGHPCAAGAFGKKEEAWSVFEETFLNEVLKLVGGQ
ncbi:MAG: DHH family phosphoesterase [Candidatus Marsarchaeota archaeon]|jgi:nanoRNase/pAp phosphatase (c-di-AMP/oligoRNAs hydrolase)|nr:DHH family phosphoesterase [Candidatus Marsarchaeota archaeon]MCL5430983.1 DHH family phosphoesterase [Candidatus Marsarchaeota archaeon]